MHKCLILSLSILLSACQATSPEPYEKDKTPEQRKNYNGAEGLVQYQKDQAYLVDKELQVKCEDAKVNLAVAKSNNNAKLIKQAEQQITDSCK